MGDRFIMNDLNFSDALELLKQGKKLQRKGWNGKDMYVVKVDTHKMHDEEREYDMEDYLVIIKSESIINPWSVTNSDLLAEDWVLLPEKAKSV